ncbi:MAG: sulfite exporter TauE/SafE family protein [Rhodobiaceae bacterium]|nr:sulfite exporter TauE/SafE family protein [Rhodobiaceae bacterium]
MEDILSNISYMHIFLACLIVFISSLAQSIFGMGWGMIAAPLLALLDPKLIPSTIVFLGFFAALYPSIVYYKNINWTIFYPAITGRATGSMIAGPVTAYLIATNKIELILGIILLITVFISASKIGRIKQTRRNHFIAGTSSGILGTLVGVGGTPMGIIHQNNDPIMVRANNNAFFMIGSIISFAILVFYDVMQMYHIYMGILLLPPLFLASITAKYCLKYASNILKPYIVTVCSLSSIGLILRGLDLI